MVLGVLSFCVAAIVTSWQQPHAKPMALVGLLAGLGLQLAGYVAWRSRHRMPAAISLTAGALAVLCASFAAVGDGWLRAFGAAFLLPFFAGAAFLLVLSVRRG